MSDGHVFGDHGGDVSFHHPDHPSDGNNHHHQNHHNHSYDGPDFSHDSSANAIPPSHVPESSRRWRRDRDEPGGDEDEDEEEQPLLMRRSRRGYSPAPILAVVVLVVIVAIMGIAIVVSKKRDGYTGAIRSFD